MTPPAPSARFRRAAEAEAERQRQELSKLDERLTEQRAVVLRLETEAEELRARIYSIDKLLGADSDASRSSEQAARAQDDPSRRDRRLLSGRDIRLKAIEVLRQSGRSDGPIHYKDWLALMMNAGYAPAGKRADAVFLSQISRSPVVKGSTKAGVYQLDSGAIVDLRHQMQDLQRAFAEAMEPSADAGGLAKQNARQRELTIEINRVNRALQEASESLAASQGDPIGPTLSAVPRAA